MREVCAVITRGTMMEADIAHMSEVRMLILSLVERVSETGSSLIGLCVVDASTGCFQLCQVCTCFNLLHFISSAFGRL